MNQGARTSVQHEPVVRTSAHAQRGENTHPLVHVHVLTTGSCCTLVLAPWFMCTCSHYWFMLYTCSCPLVHEHLFSLLFHVHVLSLLVHVVHLFSPLGSCALVLTTGSCCALVLTPWFMCTFSLLVHVVHLFSPLGSCALVLTTGSCCTLVHAPWFMTTCSHYCFMCTCSHYSFMLCTCSRPFDHVHWFSLLVHVENKCT
jgi:hypothetical protein